MAKRAKYKMRADGSRETTRTYKSFGPSGFSGKKHFYGKSDEEIDRKIRAFEKALLAVPVGRTISEIADEWWEKKEPQLSPNSITSYQSKKNEIIDRFGDIIVTELTTQQILSWLSSVAAQGYSQRSIGDRRSVLKSILDYALAKGEITRNPCSDLPTVKGTPKKKRRPASEADVLALEANKTTSLYARLYYFMEYTGCRIGEACVIQGKDIDRENHKVTISKDLAFNGNRPMVKNNPKTEAGFREVDLYDNVLEILPSYEDPETFVFFPDGLPGRSMLQKQQKKFQESIGITSTAHQFRHTYAGIMHSAEIDVKDTQARMGHANVSITQDIYTEIERQHNEKVRNKANDYIMEERLGRNKKSCPRCGSLYLKAEDGHVFSFCPDCGNKLESEKTV